MIAKCIAILAVVAQINASICGCGPTPIVLPTSGCCPQPAVLATPCNSGCSSASGAITRNVVAKGKFPVALGNCGPVPDQRIPVTTSRVTAPVQEKPTVRLPAKIPAPRTICHTCTCYKTILRPRVHQQLITVPTIQRYIETLHKPVVENIQYEAHPVNCGSGCSSCGMISGCGCGCQLQTVQVPSCGSSCAQPVQISCAQPVEVHCAKPIHLPCVQPVQTSCAQPIEVHCAQPVQTSCVQPIQTSCAQPIEVHCAQPIQLPCAQPVQTSCAQPIEVHCAKPVQLPCVQRVEIPQTFNLGCSSPCNC